MLSTIKTWRDIPGFFDFMDIYDQAVAEANDGDVLIEVGTFLGKSAAYMAEQIRKSGKRLNFTCVDNWDPIAYKNWQEGVKNDPPNPWPCPELDGMELQAAFWHCMKQVGNEFQMIAAHSSVKVASWIDDRSLSFAFIDANHLYDGIGADIAAWRNKVRPGGLLGGHDYDVALWPDVKRAVDEAFGSRVEHRGTSWLVRM